MTALVGMLYEMLVEPWLDVVGVTCEPEHEPDRGPWTIVVTCHRGVWRAELEGGFGYGESIVGPWAAIGAVLC